MGLGLAAAGVAGAASLGGAIISSNASQQAASEQTAAEEQGINTQLQMYNQTRSDLSPYRTTGQSALDTIANMYGLSTGGGTNTGATSGQSYANFYNSPNYQFALQQGTQAVNSSAAAEGQVMSGANQTALENYGQGLASQQFNNYMSQLLSLAGIGQSAAGMQANSNTSTANSISSLDSATGASEAAGTVGSANAITGGLSSIGSLGLYSTLANNSSAYGSLGSIFGSGNSLATLSGANGLGYL